ncbi:MAG: sugar ABC transporter substrate-binding protein [Spirochaetales bacterium]|nr:sugar ABC transporter substrate-binding protein [Spirochaetales bacterium]
MKKVLLIALLALMLIPAAVFANGQQDDGTMKFGYTTMDLANPYFVTVTNGVKDRAAELGIEVTVHDAKSDAASQVTAIENFIAQGMDAIIVSPIDPKACEQLIKMAHEAGIPFINPHQMIEGNDANINLKDFDYGFAGGTIAGEWIANEMGGEAEVAILGFPQMEALIERANGIKAGILAKAPNAKIVSEQSANTPEQGMQAAETIMQAHPNVKVICGTNDAGALGAMEAVKAMGMATDDFCIVGLDATGEALAKMKMDDSIYRGTVDIDPYGTGKLIIDISLEVIENGPIAEMVKIPMIPVTAANIDKY